MNIFNVIYIVIFVKNLLESIVLYFKKCLVIFIKVNIGFIINRSVNFIKIIFLFVLFLDLNFYDWFF